MYIPSPGCCTFKQVNVLSGCVTSQGWAGHVVAPEVGRGGNLLPKWEQRAEEEKEEADKVGEPRPLFTSSPLKTRRF